MKPEEKHNCPSRSELERIFLGVDDGQQRAHVAACLLCRNALAELEAQRRAFLQRHPAAPFLAAVEWRHLHGEGQFFTPRGRRMAGLGLRLAAGLSLLFAVVFFWRGESPQTLEESVRAKGGVSLRFVVERGRTLKPGKSGMALQAGDVLQVSYRAAHPGYLHFFSVESDGSLHFYCPSEQLAPIRVIPGQDSLFPRGLRLDTSSQDEIYFGVVADRPWELDSLRQLVNQHWVSIRRQGKGLAELAPLPLPAEQSWFLVRKGEGRR